MAYLYPILPSIYYAYLGRSRNHQNRQRRKIGDQGVTGMFMGYASNHEGNCYRIKNPNTKKIYETRDVVFLKKMFFGTPTKPVRKKQSTDNEDLNIVQQDKRGGVLYNCRFCHS
jgi:hypothetical protein